MMLPLRIGSNIENASGGGPNPPSPTSLMPVPLGVDDTGAFITNTHTVSLWQVEEG